MNTNKKNLQEWFSGLELPIYWSPETRDILEHLKKTFDLEYPYSKNKNTTEPIHILPSGAEKTLCGLDSNKNKCRDFSSLGMSCNCKRCLEIANKIIKDKNAT